MAKRDDLQARNIAIAKALDDGKESPAAVAERYGISYAHTFRAARSGRQAHAEAFRAAQPMRSVVGGGTFSELATTGLRRFGGRIDDEYDRVFRSLNKRVALYREMGDDPIIASVLQAVRMLIRRLGWHAEAASDKAPDREAAEFLDSNLNDMSQSWADSIDQSMGMFQYGFQLAEIVYKRRQGERTEASSKFDDEKIGWRKWTFIAPESLAPGNEWLFDEHGGLQGFVQQAPPDYQTVEVPIQKSILFRTTSEKGNPEGRSILRAMFQSYHFRRNLEEIEAIASERMGAGFPTFYLGSDVSKDAGASSDLGVIKDIVRNIRVDDQMGLVLPWAKMGEGAAEGKGILFELVSPPSKGIVDMHQVISRHAQFMAMTGLAQFVHLGMNQVGARALGESSTDFFTLAVAGWVESLSDTLNRYAVERLFRLNHFPGMTDIPRLDHEPVTRVNLAELAEYINSLAGARVITPGPELENYLRDLADLPEKPEPKPGEVLPGDVQPAPEAAEPEEGQPDKEQEDIVKELRAARQALEQTSYRPEAFAVESALVEELRAATRALAIQPVSPVQFGNVTMPLPEGFQFTQPPAPQVTVNVPAPIVNVHVPEQAVPQVVVNVPAAQLTFPDFPVPQVTVNIPDIVVPAPVVNIPAPVVNPEIKMPETDETFEFEHDDEGRTKKVKKHTRRVKG
jgi:hypothetical protein